MRIPGIVGGIGPESTIEYYRLLLSLYRSQTNDGSYPEILLHSIDMKTMLDLIGAGETAAVTAYLAGSVGRLASAGADFAILASNTPHLVFDELQAASPIPLLSIVEETCRRARAMGLESVGLFGTRFTMESGFYAQVFSAKGIDIHVPEAEDRAFIHDKYMNELVLGTLLEETRAGLLRVVSRLMEQRHIQALILGGTELPLILKDRDSPGLPFLDTTRIHAEAVVEAMLGREAEAHKP